MEFLALRALKPSEYACVEYIFINIERKKYVNCQSDICHIADVSTFFLISKLSDSFLLCNLSEKAPLTINLPQKLNDGLRANRATLH